MEVNQYNKGVTIMKRILFLTVGLLSGLAAAGAGAGGVNDVEVQRVMTAIEKVTGEIAGNQGI